MNSGNLVPQNKRTKKEQREIARKGGIRSGEVRRKKKLMKDQISLLLSLPFPDVRDKTGKKIRTMFKQLGIDDENIDNQMAMIIAIWQRALKGDYQAFNSLRDTVGEKPKDEVSVENPNATKILSSISKQLGGKNE